MKRGTSLQPASQTNRSKRATKLLRNVGPSLLINAISPLAIYVLVKYGLRASDVPALLAAAVPPLLTSLVSLIRQRRMDVLAGMVLLGMGISAAAGLLVGNPRLLLSRGAVVSGAFSLACLISLVFQRPVGFYLTRLMVAGKNTEAISQFETQLTSAPFRAAMRVQTLI